MGGRKDIMMLWRIKRLKATQLFYDIKLTRNKSTDLKANGKP
jgi:hypothetical protein